MEKRPDTDTDAGSTKKNNQQQLGHMLRSHTSNAKYLQATAEETKHPETLQVT